MMRCQDLMSLAIERPQRFCKALCTAWGLPRFGDPLEAYLSIRNLRLVMRMSHISIDGAYLMLARPRLEVKIFARLLLVFDGLVLATSIVGPNWRGSRTCRTTLAVRPSQVGSSLVISDTWCGIGRGTNWNGQLFDERGSPRVRCKLIERDLSCEKED